MATDDVHLSDDALQVPMNQQRLADAARPDADAAPRSATRRTTTRRKPLPRSTVVLGHVAGAGAAAVVVTGLAVTAGPVAALAAALGVPMAVAARMLSRANRSRSNSRRTTRRQPRGPRRPRADRKPAGFRLPDLGGNGGGAGRAPKTNTRAAGGPGKKTTTGFGMPGLPTPGRKTAAPAAGRTRATGGSPATPGPRAAANGGRTPKGGGRPASTHSGAGTPTSSTAGGSRFSRRRANRAGAATPGTQHASGTPSRTTSRRGAPTSTANGSAGIPDRTTRRGLRTPRTRVGAWAQQRRLEDQEKYFEWWRTRPKAIRQTTRRAVAGTGRAAAAAAGSTGRATAAGFTGSARPRDAAKAAYKAARANRRPGVRGQVGSVAAGAAGAVLAAGARGTANRAKPVGAAAATATRAAAKRYRKVRRLAARRARNLGKRLVWAFTGNQEAMAADRARDARRKELVASLTAQKREARRAKYAVPRPQAQAQPVQPQQQAPAPTVAPTGGPVITAPRPQQQAAPIVVPVYTQPAGTSLTGGSKMVHQFPPHAQAVDLAGSLMKWSPGAGDGALFALYDAMGPMRHTADWIQFGWKRLFNSVVQDLNTALSVAHRRQQQQALKNISDTVGIFDDMKKAFEKIHERDLQRRAMRNAHVTNVDGVHNGDVAQGFAPFGFAEQYGKALCAWRPGTHSGALFTYGDALPYMGKASWLVANAWSECVRNTIEALRGGLEPEMADGLTHIYRSYCAAATEVDNLLTSFHRTHEDDLNRRNRAGAHTANVPVRVN